MAYAIIVHTYKIKIYEIKFFQVWKTAETGNPLQKEVAHLAQHFRTPEQNIAFIILCQLPRNTQKIPSTLN